jgi:hypothetical protein
MDSKRPRGFAALVLGGAGVVIGAMGAVLGKDAYLLVGTALCFVAMAWYLNDHLG